MTDPLDPTLSRRSFLKRTTAAFGLAALAPKRLFAKDFKKSDELRDKLAALGVTVKDTPKGTEWKMN